MADLQRFIDFQGGGGHLAKWRHTFAYVFYGLRMFFLVCVRNFIKIGR
jgi:hypothetical protein